MATPFSPETRAAALASLPGTDVDLLVIGGGITGAGIARDAALRGLSVVLVEATDFAAGTSSRSSKLIHGGVRYLQQGDVGLVREAAAERQKVRAIAPHLTEPLRMVMPTYSRGMQAKLNVGLWTFEKLTTVPPDERYETWGREESLRNEPALKADRLHGSVTFVEYLTDDARLVLANVQGAQAAGARCVNHVRVTGLTRHGATTTATLTDGIGGATCAVKARVVVNAAGPWVEAVMGLAGARATRRLHLTKGVHLVVPHARLPLRHIVVMQARDKRSVFAVPRDGCTYLGTTDTDFGEPALYPDVTREDLEYLLDAANRTFAGAPLARADVAAAWAGLRPLLHEEGKSPSEISRKDEIMTDDASGLITIAGGKLTTYRRMAERVVECVCRVLGRTDGAGRTGTVPLPGGERPPAAVRPVAAALAKRLPAGSAERLVRLYGAGCERLAARVAADAALGEPVPGLPGVLRVEIAHAVDEEMALTLTDVLERRTRALLFDRTQGVDGVDAVAAMLAARLGWDAARTAAETAAYRQLASNLRSFP